MIVGRQRLDFNSVSQDQLQRLGQVLGRLGLQRRWSRLYLRGGLGAGKTSLVRAILRAMGETGRIKSPSFSVAESYEPQGISCGHLDLYRLKDPDAWQGAGLREIFTDAELVMVEWPEHGRGLPTADIDVSIDWAQADHPEGPRRLSFLIQDPKVLEAFKVELTDLDPKEVPAPLEDPEENSFVARRRLFSLPLIPAAWATPALSLVGLFPDDLRAVEVVAVRVWPAANYTRVAIEHDTANLRFNTSRLIQPDRLVIDIQGMRLGYLLRQIVARVQPNDPFIAQLRVGQFKSHIARLVFDLKQPVRPQVFTLPPIAQYQHRLVIDLYPEIEPDPLLAFLQEYESRPRSSPASEGPAQAQLPNDPISLEGTQRESIRTTEPKKAAKASQIITIAIDPGHGGEDPGAIGRGGTKEKDVVLRIARELKRQIDARPNMRAFLTRDGDFFVPLARRVSLARQVNADLFVSVHADAWVSPSAKGASVFALSDKGATSAAARWMANKENESDSIGGVRIGEAENILAQTLLDMSTTAQIKDSLKFGQAVLQEIGRVNRLHKPRVEQAGFAVLRAPDIPSILVETAFISNPEEERRLRDAQYQRAVAQAIQKGIDQYLAQNPSLAKKSRAS